MNVEGQITQITSPTRVPKVANVRLGVLGAMLLVKAEFHAEQPCPTAELEIVPDV